MVELKVNMHKLESNVRYKYQNKNNYNSDILSGIFTNYGMENGVTDGRLFFSYVQNESKNINIDGIVSIPKNLIDNIYVVSLFKGFGELNHLINSY
jgi:hypothetical protein